MERPGDTDTERQILGTLTEMQRQKCAERERVKVKNTERQRCREPKKETQREPSEKCIETEIEIGRR